MSYSSNNGLSITVVRNVSSSNLTSKPSVECTQYTALSIVLVGAALIESHCLEEIYMSDG